MVALTYIHDPAKGMEHVKGRMMVSIDGKYQGLGKLYVTDSHLSWVSENDPWLEQGLGFSVEYDQIAIYTRRRNKGPLHIFIEENPAVAESFTQVRFAWVDEDSLFAIKKFEDAWRKAPKASENISHDNSIIWDALEELSFTKQQDSKSKEKASTLPGEMVAGDSKWQGKLRWTTSTGRLACVDLEGSPPQVSVNYSDLQRERFINVNFTLLVE